MIEAQTMLELACDLAIWFEKPTTDPASKALIDRAINVLRASTAAAQPVAWTNKAQLGFLDDPACADIPMAMWSKTSPASPIPLYATVPAVQPDGVRDALEKAREYVASFPYAAGSHAYLKQCSLLIEIDAALSHPPKDGSTDSAHTRPECGAP